jgi:hypothetical protein
VRARASIVACDAVGAVGSVGLLVVVAAGLEAHDGGWLVLTVALTAVGTGLLAAPLLLASALARAPDLRSDTAVDWLPAGIAATYLALVAGTTAIVASTPPDAQAPLAFAWPLAAGGGALVLANGAMARAAPAPPPGARGPHCQWRN